MDQQGSKVADRAMLDVASAARLVGSVLDSLPLAVGLLRVGEGYPIVHCNAVLDRWLPTEMHPVVGRRFVEVFERESEQERAREVLDGVVATGEPVHFRHYETTTPTSRRIDSTLPGGLQIWTWDVFPIRSDGGSIDYLLSMSLDITDSSLAERRLVDGHQQAVNALVAIVDHAEGTPQVEGFLGSLTATVAELVGASRVVFLGARGEHLRALDRAYGLDREDLRLLGDIPCGHDDRSPLAQVVHHGQTLRAGPLPPQARARTLPVHFAVRDFIAVPWRAGEIHLGALVAFNSDAPDGFGEQAEWVMQAAAIGAALVWRQRQAELELQARQRSEADALRLHADRMAELEKAKSNFLNLASHELRGPLAVVHGYISLFLDGGFGDLDQSMTEAMGVVQGKLDEMRRLVDQLVEMARLEDQRLELTLKETDLRSLAHTAVETLLPIAAARERVTLDLPDDPTLAIVDADRLLTVVMNLVGNALKYTDGPIDIRLTAADGVAVLAVIDHGAGIEPEDLPRLFTRFGRIVTPANRHVGGTGLGLYLSRELARRHGGDIECTSALGRGTTFTLTVPAAAAGA